MVGAKRKFAVCDVVQRGKDRDLLVSLSNSETNTPRDGCSNLDSRIKRHAVSVVVSAYPDKTLRYLGSNPGREVAVRRTAPTWGLGNGRVRPDGDAGSSRGTESGSAGSARCLDARRSDDSDAAVHR